MLLSRPVSLLSAAACLAAGLAFPATAGSPVPATADIPTLRRVILTENDPFAAESFLADKKVQDAVKSADPDFFLSVFGRAAELSDLRGVLGDMSSVRSIRLGLLKRTGCAFCHDADAFPAWARKYFSGGHALAVGLYDLDKAMWDWNYLSDIQKAWVTAQKKDVNWPKLGFPARHEVMRVWALAERDALLKINSSDSAEIESFRARAYRVHDVLGSHEMTGVWKRMEELTQAARSLAEARARVATSTDTRQAALLAQAKDAPTPEARLTALTKIYDNYGERPAALLTAAPPRKDQTFDAKSRRLVGEMLKTAMLKETEGTFAGDDLKKFYDRVPLRVAFTTTSMSAVGWYHQGGDTLYLNERYVEAYVKSHGVTVESLKSDPMLLQNLARIFASTFVHEAQHHQQDIWARENKMPRLYHQGDEVEAFQVESMFMWQKMRDDAKFRAWAGEEAKTSTLVASDLVNARRMEEQGPGFFDRFVPNTHYPEILSNEGNVWCRILWHNNVAGPIEMELKRRGGLGTAARGALETRASPLKTSYPTQAAFLVDLPTASSKELREFLANATSTADNAVKHYKQIRARAEAVAAVTRERYAKFEHGDGRVAERGPGSVPAPVGQENP